MGYRVLQDDISENREKWLDLRMRKDLYTASQVSTILGFGFSSPYQLWLQKTGRAPTVEVGDKIQQRQWEYGDYLEGLITKWLREETAKDWKKVNQLWQSVDYPFLICSPDIMCQDEVGELKTSANPRQKRTWEEGIPESAEVQLLINLFVGGFSTGVSAGLVAGSAASFAWHKRTSDPEFFQYAMERVIDFMKYVEEDLPPEEYLTDADWQPVTSYFDMGASLREKKEEDDELVAQYRELTGKRQELERQAREVEKAQKAIKTRLMASCDGHSGIDLGEGRSLLIQKIEKNIKATEAHTRTEYRIKYGE